MNSLKICSPHDVVRLMVISGLILMGNVLHAQINIEDVPLNANEQLLETENGIMYYVYYQDGTLKESQPVLLVESWDTLFQINPISLEEVVTIEKNYFSPYGLRATYDKEGNLIEKYNYDDGSYESYYPDQAIKVSGTLIKGKKEGRWRYFNDIYLLSKVEHYEDGMLSGDYKEFYENGQLSLEGSYTLQVTYDTVIRVNPLTLKEEEGIEEGQMSVKCGNWKYYDLGKEIPVKVEEKRRCY